MSLLPVFKYNIIVSLFDTLKAKVFFYLLFDVFKRIAIAHQFIVKYYGKLSHWCSVPHFAILSMILILLLLALFDIKPRSGI